MMTLQVGCLSFKKPYAGLVLDGVKSIDTLAPSADNGKLHSNYYCAEGLGCRLVERHHHPYTGIEPHANIGTSGIRSKIGRGVVAGLVEVGETWCCSDNKPEEDLWWLEKAAVHTGLTEKHLTQLSNPRWLKEPLDIWTVDIPVQLLPST